MISYIIFQVILLTFSFSGLYYLEFGQPVPQGIYLTLFVVYILIWVFFSVYYKKYKWVFNFSFRDYFQSLLFSSAFIMFFLTLFVSLTDLIIVPRMFLISIVCVSSLIELLLYGLIRYWLSLNGTLKKDRSKTRDDKKKEQIKLKWMMGGFVLFCIAFFLMVKFEYGSFGYYSWLENIILILLGSWAVSIFLTGKYKYYPSLNFYYQIAPIIKSGIIMFLIVGLIYYFFRLESFSRLVLFGTISFYAILEITVFVIVFIVNKQEPVSISKSNMLNINNSNIFGQEPLSVSSENKYTGGSAIDIQSLFKHVLLKESDEIVQFLLNNIDGNYGKDSVTLLSTSSLENINVIKDQSQNLLINIHNLNDMRWLNKYFISCHNKIIPEGMLVGVFSPLEKTRDKLRSKMPKFIFFSVYPIHFLFFRVFPKLPKIRHLYFILTKGKNRIISKAEVFGRLNFCGFRIVTEKMIGSNLYFVAQKLSTISTENEPTYSTIVRLKRVGLDSKIITIHKFRTMHPYSEFIQKDIFENQNLSPSGKIENDFRVTSWGKIMRSLFIDELPQVYDWFQGRVKFVGVRALSEHYLSLYPKDLQKERIKQKPGLVPPYYADMPSSFEEIVESERQYLLQRKESPFITDLKYLVKAVHNILIKGARSM